MGSGVWAPSSDLVCDHQLDMFGGQPVGERDGVHQFGNRDDAAEPVPAFARDMLRGERGQQAIDAGCDCIGERGAVGDEDGLRERVMFGLGQEIRSDPVGTVETIGHNDDF